MEPVTTGSLLRRSFEVYQSGFVPFFTLALIFFSPLLVLQLVAPSADSFDSVLVASSGIVIILFYILLIPIASAAVVYGVFQGLRGQPATIGQCISVVGNRAIAILGLAILTILVTAVGFILCIIPGVVVTYGLFIAGPALIVEKLNPVDAMQRSWRLSDGYKWTIFFVALAIGVLQFGVSVPVNLVFGVGALGQDLNVATNSVPYVLVNGLISIVFTAFNAIVAGVIYHDLRIFREGLDEDDLLSIFD